jgi:hypothetical protein
MIKQHNFILQPFPSQDSISELKITGNISRADNNLNLNYQILGNLSQIKIPTATDNPQREDRLWETTCLEFFLAIKDSTQYWEFNLSPAKNWNVYRFSDYRENMTRETAINSLPFESDIQSNGLNLSLQLDLNSIISPQIKLLAAISAVIETQEQITYWALIHPDSTADFHLRDSFIIEL